MISNVPDLNHNLSCCFTVASSLLDLDGQDLRMYYDNKGNEKCSRNGQRIKPFPCVNSSVRKNGIQTYFMTNIPLQSSRIMNEPYAFESER